MPVLRDIVARLDLDLDDRGFKKAEKGIKGVTAGLKALGGILASAGVAIGLFRLVGLASDADETLNVLNASFENNAEAVLRWARITSTEVGRSEFQLREMAATLGAVLNPLMDRNAEAAAGMSTQMAQLAVDLGSFFNATDIQALNALRSGLTGEAEPLKKFGIVMNVATLEAFALEQGINKSVKAMSIAEKTQLRFNFIMDQTVNAQGDAARTAEGYANASKALSSSLKDLGTRIGLVVLPAVEKIVGIATTAVRAFTKWVQGTNLLQAALIVLGAIAAKVALGIIIAFAPLLLPLLKFVAIVAVAALVLDDFITFMQGGDSVIGRFIDSIFGPGSATEAVTFLKQAWADMVSFWFNDVIPGLRVLRSWFKDTIADIKAWFDDLFTSIGDWVISNQKLFEIFSDTILGVVDTAGKFFGLDFDLGSTAAGDLKNVQAARNTRVDRAEAMERTRRDKARRKEFSQGDIRKKRRQGAQDKITTKQEARTAKTKARVDKITARRKAITDKRDRRKEAAERKKDVAFAKAQGLVISKPKLSAGLTSGVRAPTVARRGVQGSGPSTTINNNNNITVNANNATAKTADVVATKTARSVANLTRHTQAALNQRAD